MSSKRTPSVARLLRPLIANSIRPAAMSDCTVCFTSSGFEAYHFWKYSTSDHLHVTHGDSSDVNACDASCVRRLSRSSSSAAVA